VAVLALDVTGKMKPHLTGKKCDNYFSKLLAIFNMLDIPFFQFMH
jgi:hypothetical protein